MLRIIQSVIFCILSTFVVGQNTLAGVVINEQNEPLIGATAVLLEIKDSTIIAFSITDKNGSFEFNKIEYDECILQISYVSYGNHSEVVELSSNKEDVLYVNLIPSSEILKEVTLKAEHIPMGILGDTINYNAAAFKTKTGDTVEDLLKKMPGIDIARDGSIKAQGEDVENVLVDGKEFFGNDPTIATKNLGAEAIDKVQVYDKQSDMAEFTGIEDGADEKTINLKLKEEYKHGGFGRAELGAANKDRRKVKLNYNRFSPNYQASVIATANNINEQAFSFNDYVNFMGGLSQAMSMSSGVFNFGGFGSPSIPEGLNTDYSGGLNFNIDINEKLIFRSNYFYLSTRKNLDKTIASVQLSDLGNFDTRDTLLQSNQLANHRVNTRLEYQYNPLTEFVLKAKFIGIFNEDYEQSNSAFSLMNDFLSNNISDWKYDNEEYGFNSDLQFRRKFLKKGRSLISSITIDKRKANVFNDIMNSFVDAQGISELSQRQDYINEQWSKMFNIAFTEPLGSQYYLTLKSKVQEDDESANKEFFDVVNMEDVFNVNLSRAFEKLYQQADFTIGLKRNSRNFKTSLNLARKFLKMDLRSLEDEHSLDQNLSYFLPSFNAETELGRNTSLNLNYNTEILLPTINQLMPVVDNRQATLITIGSMDLLPEYSHDFSLDLNYFDNFNFTNFFFNIGHSIINDRIVNKIEIDDELRKVVSPINSSKFNSSYAFVSFSKPLRAIKTKFRISSQISRNNYVSFLNDNSSEVNEFNLMSRVVVENIKKDRVDLAIGFAIDYTDRKYSLSEEFSQAFFNQSLFADILINVTESLTLSSTFDLTNYSSEFFSDATSYALWNMSISKLLLDQRLEIKVSAFDILGQNIGLTRNGGLNALTESKFNTLETYFMLSIGYRLGQKKKKDVIDI